jgi:NAD+ kinase
VEQSLNNENRIRVLSYPDYKDTEIYSRLIDQLKTNGQPYEELDLGIFGLQFNSTLLETEEQSGNVISVGGDGTALKGMYLAYQSSSVLLPLGLGEIGYLVNSDKRKYSKLIKQIIQNKFDDMSISERTVISCPTVDLNWPVFNEIAISKSGPNTLLEFNIKFNNESIDLKADGVVVSTSGGSTAYSYSAGGPIVDPSFDSVVITPIAPFSKFPRSIVLPSSTSITISIDTPKYYITSDQAKYDIFFDGVLVNNYPKNDNVNETTFEIIENETKAKILGISNNANVSEFLSQILR